jgi:probable UDP-sugar transporter A5
VTNLCFGAIFYVNILRTHTSNVNSGTDGTYGYLCCVMFGWSTNGIFGTMFLGASYVFLAATRVLITRSLSQEKSYVFLPMTVNVQAEFLKLLVCGGLALRLFAKGKESVSELTHTCSWRFLKWALPGFLYFLDNLLTFYVLARLSPAVSTLLGNFVIITTAVLFRLILK